MEEIIKKISDTLESILGSKDFDLYNETYKVSYSEKLSTGVYSLKFNKKVIATFELHPMINCCGICVSTKAFVYPKFRNKGLGRLLNSIRIDIARKEGYSLLLCTDIEDNTNQRKILKANGWRDLTSFVNRRTGNKVYISVINL